MLAAIPFGLVVLSLLGYVLNARAQAAQVDLGSYLQNLFPDYGTGTGANPFDPILRLAEGVVRSRRRLTLVGLPLFVWFATRLFGSLRAALCEVFDTRETRSWLRGKTYDALLVVATGLLFAASTALSEFLLAAEGRHGFVEFFGAQLLAFGFLVTLFVVIFKYAPAHRVRWDTALLAGLVCAVAVELAKAALGAYFRAFVHPDQLVSDATLGALILLLAWVYYLTFVFLIGAQIAQVYELRRRQAAQRAVLR